MVSTNNCISTCLSRACSIYSRATLATLSTHFHIYTKIIYNIKKKSTVCGLKVPGYCHRRLLISNREIAWLLKLWDYRHRGSREQSSVSSLNIRNKRINHHSLLSYFLDRRRIVDCQLFRIILTKRLNEYPTDGLRGLPRSWAPTRDYARLRFKAFIYMDGRCKNTENWQSKNTSDDDSALSTDHRPMRREVVEENRIHSRKQAEYNWCRRLSAIFGCKTRFPSWLRRHSQHISLSLIHW